MQTLTMDVVWDSRRKSPCGWTYRLGEATGDGQRSLGSGALDVGARGSQLHITLRALCDEDGEWNVEWKEKGAGDMQWSDVLEVVNAAAGELPAEARAAWRDACEHGAGPDATPSIEGWRVVC